MVRVWFWGADGVHERLALYTDLVSRVIKAPGPPLKSPHSNWIQSHRV